MFRKILYPTDFSDCSAKVLQYVKQLKNAGAEEIVVLNVIDEREIKTMMMGTGWFKGMSAQYERELREKMMDDAQSKLLDVKAEIESVGLKATTKTLVGILFTEILKVAEEDDVSLIALGSHGKSNIEEMVLGSVSENVIKKAKRPTLIVARDQSL